MLTFNVLLATLHALPIAWDQTFLGRVRGGEFLLLAKFGAICVVSPHGGEGSDSL